MHASREKLKNNNNTPHMCPRKNKVNDMVRFEMLFTQNQYISFIFKVGQRVYCRIVLKLFFLPQERFFRYVQLKKKKLYEHFLKWSLLKVLFNVYVIFKIDFVVSYVTLNHNFFS